MWLTNNIFRQVLYKTNTVCCLCFKGTGGDALGIYDEICLDDTDVALELSTIIVAVFQNKISAIEYLSHSVCKECAKSAINAFRFIERCTAMNNTMINTIANLDEITEKKVVTGRGMYIMADPENFEGKVFCDTRKTFATLVLKRFQKFVQSESAPKKSKKGNVECEACGVVLQRKSLHGHRKRCKGQMNKLQSNIELDNIENKEVNDIKEKNGINEDKKEEKNEITNGAMDHNSVDSDEGNVFGDESDSWCAEKEIKRAERRSYLEKLEKVTCQYCHIPLKHKYKIQNHSLFSCKKIPKNEKELLKKKCEDRKIQREALQKQLEMIKANGGDVKSYKLSLKRKICEFCGASLSTNFSLKKHLLTLCKGLDESNRTEEYVTALLKINPYKRRLCTTNVGKAKTENLGKKLKIVTCSYCDQSFQGKTILLKHIYKECKNIPIELKYAVCSHCGKQCLRNSLAMHEKSHSQQFSCSKCGKIFKGKRAFHSHLRMPDCVNEPYVVPEPEKKYGCHACGKLFVKKMSVDWHYARFHTDSGGFKCKLCGKRFGRKDSLKTHMVVHTKEKKFDCEMCGGSFVSKASLLYHTRTHTGEKPYKCEYCDERFLSASRRNIHTRINHLPPQLECKYCFKMFTHWGALCKHRRRHFMPGSSLYMPQLEPPEVTKKIVSSDDDSEDEY